MCPHELPTIINSQFNFTFTCFVVSYDKNRNELADYFTENYRIFIPESRDMLSIMHYQV